jgi:hypothetical protein
MEKFSLYSLFVVKVPKEMGFIYSRPGRPFSVRFADIFNVFHLKQLHLSIVHLVALGMVAQLTREENLVVAIMEPFFLLERVMRYPADRKIVEACIEEFLVANHDKEVVLVPYFLDLVIR